MKKNLCAITTIIALASSSLVSRAQTIFHDTFGSGSTLNNTTTNPPTDHSTGYNLISSKNYSPAPAINSGSLRFGIAATTAGHIELQALFTNSAIAIASNGDYVELVVTFVAATNILNQAQAWAFGLYNSGFPQSYPFAGGLNGVAVNTTTTNAIGNAQNWAGYWSQLFGTNAGSSVVRTRPVQNGAGATDDRNQDVMTTGSGSQSFGNPAGATIGTNAVPSVVSITQGGTYTEDLVIGFAGQNSLYISNTLYSGGTTNGTIVASSQYGGVATNATFITAGFDSFAIGWRSSGSLATWMDISSITINSQNSAPTAPVITQEPVSASATLGGSVPFTVNAQGINLVYEWKRNGTNVNSPNLSVSSGPNSSTLLVSPITTADFVNTYSCLIIGAGNLTTNTVTVGIAQRTAKNLVWSGGSSVWDLANTVSWKDTGSGNSPTVFNYGDNVTFDDTATTFTTANLSNFLNAGTVTVTGGNNYIFQNTAGGGTIAGTAKLVYNGSIQLNINNANSYNGGTLMGNATGHLFLGNASALGTGPVTNAVAGGIIEFATAGSATTGIGDSTRNTGDLVVNDDLTIQPDTDSGFSTAVFGNLRGVAGKTLSFSPAFTTNSARFRVYGTNSSVSCDLHIDLGGLGTAPASALYGGTILAFYNPSGTQTYNGLITGVGGVMPADSGSTSILTAQNTFAGGTTMRFGQIGIGADSTPTTGTVTSGPLGTGSIFVNPDQGGGNSTATIFSSGGAHTIANTIQWPSITNNQTLGVGGTNAITFNGAVNLQASEATNGPVNRTFSVTNTALSTFNGVISDNGQTNGIIKQGNGIMVLTPAENYIGPTLVSNGTLQVNGSLLAASSVTVGSNAFIGGTGTINGSVTVVQGGGIAPGASIGTLNVGGNLTSSGNLRIEVNRAGLLSDKTVVAGFLTNSGTGTVTVTNLGTALQVGDTFTLFNKGMSNANALTVLGGGAVWNNQLAQNGTIAVATVVSTQPTNITFSVSGGNTLNMSWPADHQTWVLLSNSTGLGAVSNWFPVLNSSNVTSVSIPVAPNRTNVFYRLVAP